MISCFVLANEAGLTLEQRHSVKRDFEGNELKLVFELLLNKLQSTLPSISSTHAVFSSTLAAIEKILLWTFSSSSPNPRRHMETSANVENIDWRPPNSWKQLVLDQQLVEFFFHIYVTLKSLVSLRRRSSTYVFSHRSIFRTKQKLTFNFAVRYSGRSNNRLFIPHTHLSPCLLHRQMSFAIGLSQRSSDQRRAVPFTLPINILALLRANLPNQFDPHNQST